MSTYEPDSPKRFVNAVKNVSQNKLNYKQFNGPLETQIPRLLSER